MKLVVEVEIQSYGEDEKEQEAILNQIRTAVVAVCELPQIAVGTFIKSNIK